MNPPGGMPMGGGAPAPTPAPIHDVVDVVSFFPYPVWMVVLMGLAVLVPLCLLGWFLFLKKRAQRPLSAQERAIAALVRLQAEALSPYEFGVRISDILRGYLDEAFGIRAVTATSLEFLEAVKDHPRFSEEERLSLREFLESVDLIKYARVEAGGEELGRLFMAAEAVVRKPEKEEKKGVAA